MTELEKPTILSEQSRVANRSTCTDSSSVQPSTNIQQTDELEYVFDGCRGACQVCHINLTSPSHANEHLQGKQHKKRSAIWKSAKLRTNIHLSGTVRDTTTLISSSSNEGDITLKSQSDIERDVCSTKNEIVAIDSNDVDCRKSQDLKFDPSDVIIRSEVFTSKVLTSDIKIFQHYESEMDSMDIKQIEKQECGPDTVTLCPICNIDFHNKSQWEEHLNSPKHKQNMNNYKIKFQTNSDIACSNQNTNLTQPESQFDERSLQKQMFFMKCNLFSNLREKKMEDKIVKMDNFNKKNISHDQTDIKRETDQNETLAEISELESETHHYFPHIQHLTKRREAAQGMECTISNVEYETERMKLAALSLIQPEPKQQETVPLQVSTSASTSSNLTSTDSAEPINNAGFDFSNETNRDQRNIDDLKSISTHHMHQQIFGTNHLTEKDMHHKIEVDSVPHQNMLICKIGNESFTGGNETFTGNEAQQQHRESERHKRMEVRFQTGVPVYCDYCKVYCTGPANYQQHLLGIRHKKRKAGIIVPDVMEGTNSIDKTKWHHCNVCGCQLNSLAQLRSHEQSPSHKAKLLQQLRGRDVAPGNQIIRDPYQVCNFKMNTPLQLQTHEQPAKHLNILRKNSCEILQTSLQQQLTNRELTLDTSNCSYTTRDDSLLPLEKILSEQLHSKECLAKSCSDSKFRFNTAETERENKKVFKLQNTYQPVHVVEDFVSNCDVSISAVANGCDDESVDEHGSTASKSFNLSTESEFYRPSGAIMNPSAIIVGLSLAIGNTSADIVNPPADIVNPPADIVNPFAATHRFYCHTCRVPINSKENYESHLKGKRHLAKVCVEPAPTRAHFIPPVEQQLSCNNLPYTKTVPRNYQIELYRKAMADNTLCFLPTGTGKTQVAAMVISAMLEKFPTKNVLFLVDKVLLVIQQSLYLCHELQENSFSRCDPDHKGCDNIEKRPIRIASVCMENQNTQGVPLWKVDVLVVTAAYCHNLLNKHILHWEDFSLVVFDEAHHCEKGHPFNSLLACYHRPILEQCKRPKILGLTASPAGKADVPKTVQMLQTLILNMGNVRMSVVEEQGNLETLTVFQSNCQMIVRQPPCETDAFEMTLKHELNVYITFCVIELLRISNIKFYMNLEAVKVNMQDDQIKGIADSFIESNLDEIQSSLNMIDTENAESMNKVQFALFINHVQSMCMALNSLEEGGTFCIMEEISELEKTESNFSFAKGLGMPTLSLQSLLCGQASGEHLVTNVADQTNIHLKRLLDELTDIPIYLDQKSISLVLVKQRATAHYLTDVLQRSERMRSRGLNTACVVGHGSGGLNDKGMSVNQQKCILEDIKQYKYQVVVATSVAEEGVDWPECERVISMYPPSTVSALVQMRGRARTKDSKFIVLCASTKDENMLHDILSKEKNMTEATRILVEQSQMT